MGPGTTTNEGDRKVKWFGREPAQWLQLTSGLLIFLSPILHLTGEAQGAINAALTALFGFITALAVSREKAAPLVAGLLKALIAVALAFRLDLSPDMQVGIMVGVEAIVGFFLRTQVVAPTSAEPPASPEFQRVR